MLLQPKKFLESFSNFWSYWISPPKLFKRYTTVRDVQKQVGIIGGRQFSQQAGTEQAFFWMPNTQATPNIGEYIYMRYVPDTSGNVERILSHIHYPVSRKIGGGFEVNKYYASTDTATAVDYRYQAVDREELSDLLMAAEGLKTSLQSEWGTQTL